MGLIAQHQLASPDSNAAGWQKATYDDLSARLTPPSAFPCTFSQNAFRRELLQFAFIEAPGAAGLDAGRAALQHYVRDSRAWDGRVATAKPLLVVFSPQAAQADSLADYQAIGWQALQYWHDHDPAPWPDDVATDPETRFWSFCFDGMQLFVNMSAPAHDRRKSRNLGRHLTLVINPRERFDLVAGNTPEGRRVRTRIRERAARYDGLEHSPLLGSYTIGDLEWVQYALPDDNSTAPPRCPFVQKP